MGIRVDPTPNPIAMKFTVGKPVGGPGTFVEGSESGEEYVDDILALEGVTSVFVTADFVTISKTPEASWDAIVPDATAILENHFEV